MTLPLRLAMLCALACAIAACPAKPKTVLAPAAGAPTDAGGLASGEADPDEVRPVYAGTPTIASPDAQALCNALYELPAERQKECCKLPRPQPSFTAECTRVATLALQGGQVKVDSARLATCRAKIADQLSSCEGVGPVVDPLPDECQGLFSGALPAGAVCRSALECAPELTCAGLGPTVAGKCAAQGAAGAACHPLTDPLAVYTRQKLGGHAPCAGFCARNHCADLQPLGSDCLFDDPCGPGNHCEKRKCAAGPPKLETGPGPRCPQPFRIEKPPRR